MYVVPLYESIVIWYIMLVAYVTCIILNKMTSPFFEHMAVKRRYFTTLSAKAILILKAESCVNQVTAIQSLNLFFN
jgi:hypothetical protein